MIGTHSSLARQDVVQRAIATAPREESFHARRFFNFHPEWTGDSSVLLDLAYEEYCQVVDRGLSIDAALFAAQFPEIESSLLRLLEVHSFVLGTSQLPSLAPPIHWPSAGDQFLGFGLNEEIGRGAFSRVFLSREVNLGHRKVVVKISQRGDLEAAMLGALDHPNIVPIHSMTTDETGMLSALCMPYLGRTTAADWMKTRFHKQNSRFIQTLSHLHSVITIGKGVCRGLQFAHEHDFLHCDVKPSNILVTQNDEPILLDFNLSMDRTRDKYLMGGTLLYMAPEQLMWALGDETRVINESTDIYGLGATLYELATGESPFRWREEPGARLGHVIEAALEERRLFVAGEPSLPSPFGAMIQRALAFDQSDRFQSAHEFFECLSACQEALSRTKQAWFRPAVLSGILALGFLGDYGSFNQSPREIVADPHPMPESTSDRKPTGEISPAENLKEIMRSAQNAEHEGQYGQAIESYRRAFRQQALSIADRQFLNQSLLYCLLMTSQIHEAEQFLSEITHEGIDERAALAPRTLSLIQSSIHGSCDIKDINNEVGLLKRKMASDGNHSHLLLQAAVLHAAAVSQSAEQVRERHNQRARQHRRNYLKAVIFQGDEPVAMNQPKLD